MAFARLSRQNDSVELLQRSLDRGRLGHAYLFHGADLDELEMIARTLAKVLNCERPTRRRENGPPVDCCNSCSNCRKTDEGNHPDVQWIRPESKSRQIRIDPIRELLHTVYLKPTQAPHKVAIMVGADRLNANAANAFLKTLEEPPQDSIFILLSTEPQRILETILSRCLRLGFGGEMARHQDAGFLDWLGRFSEVAAVEQKSLLSRYRLLSVVLQRLNEIKEVTEETLTKRSPLESHDDLDPKLKEKWEDELTAAVESEYRRQRSELLAGLQWWFRDVWLETQQFGREMLLFPTLAEATARVARRISPEQAMQNVQGLEQMQRLLFSNVQEALALEVGLLKLKV